MSFAICVIALVVIVLIWMIVVISNQADTLQLRIEALERTMLLQQKYNDQIDGDISRLESRTRAVLK